MTLENIPHIIELAFTIIGVVVIGGTIFVKVYPGDADNAWWNKWVLSWVPAILPGDLAAQVTGKGAVNKKVLLGLIKKARETYDNLKKETN